MIEARRCNVPAPPTATHDISTVPIGRWFDISRSFCATDDDLLECMTCGVVSGPSMIDVRSLHHVPVDEIDGQHDLARTVLEFACTVCATRGSAILLLGVSGPS